MSGAKRIADIAPDHLALMNAGRAESATLTETLAVDFAALMGAALPDAGDDMIAQMRGAADQGVTRRMALAGQLIWRRGGIAALDGLGDHASDTVRGWGCYLIGAAEGMTLPDRLAAIRPLADDPHFGVREWAWLALRPHIVAGPDMAIACLRDWTSAPSDRLRRFASEATRPRGVWCAHIPTLRQQPERALPILQPLLTDPSRYVQDSVGNRLNDASKDRPDWVQLLCAAWMAESETPETARICKRALRSIRRLEKVT